MRDSTIEVQVPATLLEYDLQPERIQKLVTEWLVLDLFTNDEISSGKAAKLLGISRLEFLDLLHRRRIAYLDFSSEELEDELNTVRNFQVNAEK